MNYLDITNEGLKLGVNLEQNAMELWSRLENQAQLFMDEKMKENSTKN